MRSLAVEKTGRVHEDREAGAVAVVVALLFATVFIGVAAVAIDLGSLWATQRSLVTDTDAAALAAARTLSEMTRNECETQRGLALSGSGQVYNQVDDLLRTNTPTDELIEVRIACGQRAGKVRVDARQPAVSAFSGALGVADPSAVGRSVAEWTRPGFNPIPLAVCESQLASVNAPQEQVIISYKSAIADQNSDCLDWLTEILGEDTETSSPQYAPGNWGWLEFDDLFDGQSFLGGIVCDLESTGYWCEGQTGNNVSNSSKLFETLRDEGEVFQFVLFDYTRNPNNPNQTAAGSNADFRINAVVEAQLVACAKQESHLPAGRSNGCTGNPSYLVLDVLKITPFGDDDVEGRRADLSLCGDRLTDVCTNQDF
jgi:hypothetical protein